LPFLLVWSLRPLFLPMPGILLLVALGAVLNPFLVGLVDAVGVAIGGLAGYILGYSGCGIARSNKWFVRVEDWMRKWGAIAPLVYRCLIILSGVCIVDETSRFVNLVIPHTIRVISPP